ncbi:hypothetical protein E2C01_074283 [Portunus trituberculatus]|uniref:Uncharacterized protein n=1 Tax=Portunus trituberculatus TaxID=210409 RepID=A0A5B7ICW9_PORTR|nr:hypothetical protein [Portunus trituberculatus]
MFGSYSTGLDLYFIPEAGTLIQDDPDKPQPANCGNKAHMSQSAHHDYLTHKAHTRHSSLSQHHVRPQSCTTRPKR